MLARPLLAYWYYLWWIFIVLKNLTKQIGSTLIGGEDKTKSYKQNTTRAKPQNNSKHSEGHADHEEAQAAEGSDSLAMSKTESKE